MAAQATESPSWTVLIVDDEPQVLRLLVRVFERAGHRVLSAANGDAAVEVFTAHAEEIELLLLDVVIPPDGAGAVLERVLNDDARFSLVLTSGDELDEALRARLDAFGGHFVRKPFAPRELLEKLQSWVQE